MYIQVNDTSYGTLWVLLNTQLLTIQCFVLEIVNFVYLIVKFPIILMRWFETTKSFGTTKIQHALPVYTKRTKEICTEISREQYICVQLYANTIARKFQWHIKLESQGYDVDWCKKIVRVQTQTALEAYCVLHTVYVLYDKCAW